MRAILYSTTWYDVIWYDVMWCDVWRTQSCTLVSYLMNFWVILKLSKPPTPCIRNFWNVFVEYGWNLLLKTRRRVTCFLHCRAPRCWSCWCFFFPQSDQQTGVSLLHKYNLSAIYLYPKRVTKAWQLQFLTSLRALLHTQTFDGEMCTSCDVARVKNAAFPLLHVNESTCCT